MKNQQIVFTLLIIQPVIDLLTSLTTLYFEWTISFGALVRPFIMVGILSYIIYYSYKHNKKILVLLFGSFFSILIMLIVNLISKENINWFIELNFAFKTGYSIVMISLGLLVLKREIITRTTMYNAINIAALTIGGSYWLSIATNTSINSYAYEGGGYSGWFYAANELSVIVVIFVGLTVIKLLDDNRLISWLSFILILSMVPTVGTKTSFVGGIVILLTFLFILIWNYKLTFWKDRTVILYTVTLILFFIITPLSPIGTNQQSSTFEPIMVKKEQTELEVPQHEGHPSFLQRILSSRDIYLVQTIEEYKEASTVRKTFGLGYAGDYKEAPKIVEMDFFDLFFSYGFVGFILLLLPFLYLIRNVVIFPLTNRSLLILIVLSLCLGISFLAGHVLFAPSVMSYLIFLFIMQSFEIRKVEQNRAKKA